jgi:hypothetical protein
MYVIGERHEGVHARQRGDAWELRLYLGGDPVTGKQRYASRTVRGGHTETNGRATRSELG